MTTLLKYIVLGAGGLVVLGIVALWVMARTTGPRHEPGVRNSRQAPCPPTPTVPLARPHPPIACPSSDLSATKATFKPHTTIGHQCLDGVGGFLSGGFQCR